MDSADFGSDTRIPVRVRAVLMDCFETLVAHDGYRAFARRGVVAFLTHYASRQSVPIAVISDADHELVERALREADLLRFVAVIFGRNTGITLPDGRHRKSLRPALDRLQVSAAEAVFIGDSPLDGEAAQAEGVPFIRVPRSEDTAFDFTALITGASRYRSSEFSAIFLESLGVGPRAAGSGATLTSQPASPASGQAP